MVSAWEQQSRESLAEFLTQSAPYLLFVVLLTITIFRKELSTNDEYRSASSRRKEGRGAEDSVSRLALQELIKLNNHGLRFKTLFNDIAEDLHHGFNLPEIKDQFFASLLEGNDTFEFKSLYKLGRRRDKERDSFHLGMKDNTTPTLKEKKNRLDTVSDVILVRIMTFLTYKDIAALGSCSLSLARDTRSDTVWRRLWFQNFGDMWTQDSIVNIRKARHIEWNPCKHVDMERSYRQLSGLSGPDDAEADWQPQQGWFMFFLEFDACWIDWLLAGFSSEDCCLVGIGGNIYDLTAFLPHHPGSFETLSEVCGGDATDHFVDMGHSSHAVGLAKKMMIYSPYDETEDFPSSPVAPSHLQEGTMFPMMSLSLQGQIQSSLNTASIGASSSLKKKEP